MPSSSRYARVVLQASLTKSPFGIIGITPVRRYASSSSTTATTTTNNNNNNNHSSLLESYKAMIDRGDITPDPHQERAIQALNRLQQELQTTDVPPLPRSSHHSSPDNHHSLDTHKQEPVPQWKNLFGNFFGHETPHVVKKPPKGVYLHGGVGSGKTFVMNLFYNHIQNDNATPTPTWQQEIHKVHFHKFMLDVHQQMHEAKYVDGLEGGDPVLERVIQRIVQQQGRLICFDEFQVTDVADALILRRLFTGLWNEGAVVVATSNRPPQDLYLNGLQRDRFLPFIDLLLDRCQIVSLWDSNTDYRLIQAEHKAKGVYFIDDAKKDFHTVFHALVAGRNVVGTSLTTQGRTVAIPMACWSAGIARFAFEDLCAKALGAADYLVIGQHFHTVFVSNIPTMTLNEVNYLRRFIVFVDVMYECHVKLIVHAAAAPSGLFEVDLENKYNDEVFAFDRTRSRLEEMGSDEYLQQRWTGNKSSRGEGDSQATVKVLLEPSLSDNTVDSEPPIGRGVV